MTKLATAEAVFAEPVAPGALSSTAPWLDQRRARALDTVRLRGVPHRRVEDWKYSDLKSALDAANDIEIGKVGWSVDPIRAGAELFDLAAITSAPDWVRAHLGKSAGNAAVPAASLAFAQSGFALRIAKNAVVTPVKLAFSGSGHARGLVVLEEGAQLTLIETPATGSFSNLGIEAVIGPNAHLTLVRMADAAPQSIQIEDVAVRVARDGTFHAHLVNCGASLGRLNLRVTLKEPGANAHFSGVSVLGSTLHADVTTEIYHASGQTHSTQLFKKVVGGRARAVYQGKIIVAKGANGSDSRQTAKAILLGERAEADLKPELEILADDVKCAHGAAIGDLDADSLFYLRSRGLPEKQARNLLIRAFLDDAVLPIADNRIRNAAWDMVESALSRATERAS